MKESKNKEKGIKILSGKIAVSKFAYQKAQEKQKLLEKDVTENVIESNRDYPESDSASIASTQLKNLKELMKSFYCVEREPENEFIQVGDVIIFKDKKIGKFSRVVDGYAYSTNVCPSLIHLIGKSRGEKVNFGIFSEVEILDFYPTNEDQTISNQAKKVI